MQEQLTHVGQTILATINTIGYIPFAVMVLVDIILYRLHPVLGILGSLFLFALLMGFLH